jgi:hypothetical protein
MRNHMSWHGVMSREIFEMDRRDGNFCFCIFYLLPCVVLLLGVASKCHAILGSRKISYLSTILLIILLCSTSKSSLYFNSWFIEPCRTMMYFGMWKCKNYFSSKFVLSFINIVCIFLITLILHWLIRFLLCQIIYVTNYKSCINIVYFAQFFLP